MPSDPVVDSKVVRAIATDGTILNLRVDTNGNLLVATASGVAETVKVADGVTATQLLAVDASGRLSILSIANALPAGTNVIGHVIADAGSVVDTELPAAAALTDSNGNPTTPLVGSALLAFNGTNWARVYTINQFGDGAALATSPGVSAEWLYNGTNWDRARSDPASTGRQAVADFPGSTTAANVLNGYQTFSTTTGATTLITVPQARTWVGTIGASVSAQEVAAGTVAALAIATFTTAGTGVTPAAGTYFVVRAEAGANAATGLVGSDVANSGSMPLIVIAPAGNSVTVQVASTNAGTASHVDAFASGQLL